MGGTKEQLMGEKPRNFQVNNLQQRGPPGKPFPCHKQKKIQRRIQPTHPGLGKGVKKTSKIETKDESKKGKQEAGGPTTD